ncbi:hypothetical protein AAKU58_004328 [Oxalobacteraceae bacterium GrIS 1.18]
MDYYFESTQKHPAATLKPNNPISEHHWFIRDDRSPWDTSVLNFIERKGLVGFYEALTMWGMAGVMDLGIPREQRRLDPVTKESVIEWARTHGENILGSPEKLSALNALVDQENELLKQEGQIQQELNAERFNSLNSASLNRAADFKESLSKLPSSKEENLEIIKRAVGLEHTGK